MNHYLTQLALDVIRHADGEHPANEVLRDVLREQPALSAAEKRAVAAAVFGFYRWQGWLPPQEPLGKQLEDAAGLAHRFREAPQTLSPERLLSKCIPGWVRLTMIVTLPWVRALQTEPTLWLRCRPGQGPAVAAHLGDCEARGDGLLSDTLRYTGETDLFLTPAFQTGRFEIQDLSSQAVGWLCAPQPGQTWWDACAGEGGKTLHLSALMRNQGLIWASDRVPWRLDTLKRRAARADVFNYRCALWDGGPKPPTHTRFDGVLVDAPCSGLGNWQRKPHARWTVSPEDVEELSEIQLQLLEHVAPSVKPGGRLVYSVCTMTRAETAVVAVNFSELHPEFQPLPLVNPLTPAAEPAAQQWFWPQDHQCNGMFVAAWQRTAAAPKA